MLLAQRELDAINEVAKTELKVKGNSAHNSAKKQASIDRTAQYREQLQLNQDVELASRIRKIQGRNSSLHGQTPGKTGDYRLGADKWIQRRHFYQTQS